MLANLLELVGGIFGADSFIARRDFRKILAVVKLPLDYLISLCPAAGEFFGGALDFSMIGAKRFGVGRGLWL